MNYQIMIKARSAGVTSGKGMLVLELFRLAAKSGNLRLRMCELAKALPDGSPEKLVAEFVQMGLVEALVVPDCRQARLYHLSPQGREVVGLPPLEQPEELVRAPKAKDWTPAELSALGKSPDDVTARFLGRTEIAVRAKRQVLGIPIYGRDKVTHGGARR